jgi:hypothetical protein
MDRSQESVNNNSSSKPIYKSSSQHRILPSERIVYEHSQALQQPHANINKQGYMVNYMDTK